MPALRAPASALRHTAGRKRSLHPSSGPAEGQAPALEGAGGPRSRARPTPPHEAQAVPAPARPPAAPLTGRRARRLLPRSRCLGPGSCHRGLPGPAAPRRRPGSGRGGTRRGPGCPARPPGPLPPGPAPRTRRPWPAQGSAPPAPAAPRHSPQDARGRGWGRARGPGLRIRWRDRAGDRGSALRRAGRRVCRAAAAAAAASSAGLNLKRKKSLFRGGGGGAGVQRGARRPAPAPAARPAPAPTPRGVALRTPAGPPKPQGKPASRTPQRSCPAVITRRRSGPSHRPHPIEAPVPHPAP